MWAFVGFVSFALGVLSLILSLVGLKLTMFDFMYNHGIWTVLTQLILLFGGIIILYVARTTVSEED
jgi:hypothetical protein